MLATATAPQRGPAAQQVSVDGAMGPLVDGSRREVRTPAIGTVISGRQPGTVRCDDLSYFCWLVDAAQRAELRDGAATTVLAAIHTLPLPTGSDTGTPARVQAEVLGYLEPRVAQMRYAAFRAQGLPIGSGIVESANKLVVEARMKRAGRRWAARHVTPLVAIRGALCSGRWDEAWAAITRARSPRARRCPVASPPAPVASSAKL